MTAYPRPASLPVLWFFAVGCWGLWLFVAAAQAAPINVDAQVSVSFSGVRLNRTTGTFDTVASIKNTSSTPIASPVSLVISQITPSSVTVANASGRMPGGEPFITVPVVAGGLAPGATVGNIVVRFQNPARVQFTFVHHVFGEGQLTAPGVRITAPANLSYTNISPTTVTGTVGDPVAQVTINGIATPVSNARFAAAVPLNEGPNTVTAVATTSTGTTSTASVVITLDTTAPRVAIYSPTADGSTTAAAVNVTGLVNDIVVGTVNPEQATVTVNGVTAQVSNRSFLAANVPLALGANTIQAVATDRVGNRATASISVRRTDVTGQPTLTILSGNGQSGPAGSVLPAPLVVQFVDAAGLPQVDKPVVFRVINQDGMVSPTAAADSWLDAVAVNTDSQGQARTQFRLGRRAGVGNNLVEASVAGAASPVDFTATATAAGPALVVVDSGNNQSGVVGQPLPLPFIAIVTDGNNNRLPHIPMTFTVLEGAGNFAGSPTLQTTSDGDGRVAATLTLGPNPGVNVNLVEVTFAGNTSAAAAFLATGLVPGPAAETRISGVVLDNSNNPIPGVTMRLLQINQGNRSNIPQEVATAVRTDAQGQFVMQPVPVGVFKLMADGGTAQRSGTWPTLEYDMITVSGQNNTLGVPVYLPELLPTNRLCVSDTTGGTLRIPQAPGFALTIAAGSATFPGGARTGCVSVTPVNMDKVPMAPGFGQQPRFIVTIQPVGTVFNPPAQMTIPNVDGLAPRAVTEMYSYDHDLAAFVAIGSATVSADGATITSDPGSGVIKAGWHCGGNPNPTGAAGTCQTCQRCDGARCVPEPDSPTIPRPGASVGPGAVQDNGDAVALGEFGANTGFGYDLNISCQRVCSGGVEKYGLSGDITPAAAWQVQIHTRAQLPGCAMSNRTAANIQRTTTHELKHTTFLMSVINGAKASIGNLFGSSSDCEQAKATLTSNLQTDWNAMVTRQAAHTDFAGEMRYTFTCQGGVTTEVPLGVTY